MKHLILFALVAFPQLTFAKDKITKFTEALNETVQADLKNENNDRLVAKPVGRGPASVEPDVKEAPIRDLNKFEKMDSQKAESNRW